MCSSDLGVAEITLARPEAANAIDLVAAEELAEADWETLSTRVTGRGAHDPPNSNRARYA